MKKVRDVRVLKVSDKGRMGIKFGFGQKGIMKKIVLKSIDR